MSPRRRLIAVLTASTYFLAGCYTYVPAATAPAPGVTLAFELSDAGRVALGDRLGSGVTRVEGQVVDVNADEYAVAVSAISQISGGRSRWSGEQVRLRRDYVVRTQERKLSRGRTALAIGAAVAGAAALVLTRALLGDGGPDREGGNEGKNGES